MGMKHNVPIQSLIDHIKTAIDVDPWAKEMVEELLKEQENDLRIMFNRCQATAKLLTSGSACNGCIKREKCERLTKYEP